MYKILRSSPILSRSLPSIIDCYQAAFKSRGVEVYRDEEFRGFGTPGLLCRHLYALEAFSVNNVTVSQDLFDAQQLEAASRCVGALGQGTRRLFLAWMVLVERSLPLGTRFELRLNCGWSNPPEWNDGYWFVGFWIGSASPGFLDKEYRCDLIQRIVNAMGVSEHIQVELKDDVLSMTSTGHWRLFFMAAEPGGLNLQAANICGFSSFEDARRAAESVRDQITKQTYETRIAGGFDGPQYEATRELLDGIGPEWSMHPMGELTPAAVDVVNGRSSDFGVIPRISVLQWYEKAKGTEYIFQLDAVPTLEGSCLEFISNHSDVKRVLTRARTCTELDFSVVEE